MDAFKVIEDTEPGWWNDRFRDIRYVKCSCGRYKAEHLHCMTKHKGNTNA